MNGIKIFLIVLIATLPGTAERVRPPVDDLQAATEFIKGEISEQADSCIKNLDRANDNLQLLINKIKRDEKHF